MEKLIVKTKQGLLQGDFTSNVYGKTFYSFKGIPYAKPPVGDLRFKDPEPVEPWSGVKYVSNFGNKCAQKDWMTGILGSEDCLYLNIYTKSLKPKKNQAVMFWIHGGSFVFGSGDDDLYGPDYLIEKDVVLVTINYRVGILGFLNLDDEEAPGNQGLKDQVLALRWVQQNISHFGGDPNNVTIFGESAGGASVHYLTISPLAQGLFHKAIFQSGVAINPWASVPHSMKDAAQRISAALGNEISDSRKLLQFLRTVDAHRLVEAEANLRTWQDHLLIINVFGPSVDCKSKQPLLTMPLRDAIKFGIRVPCICGYVSHEGIIVLAGVKDETYAKINKHQDTLLVHPTVKSFLKERNISTADVKKMFLSHEDISINNIDKLANLKGAIHFYLGIHHIVHIQSKISNVPMYLYKFDYYSEANIMQKLLSIELKGTCHGEELAYIFYPKLYQKFNRMKPIEGSVEDRITKRFVELWTNFAITGNPTPAPSRLIPFTWKPVNDPFEYDCLKISEDMSMIKETNLLYQMSKTMQTKL